MAKQAEGQASQEYKGLLARLLPRSKWIKIHGHEGQESGISDLLGCVEGRFVAVEMKMRGHDGPSPLQRLFTRDIERAGGVALVWWHDDRRTATVQADELARQIKRRIDHRA